MSLDFDLERIRGGLARIQPDNSRSQFIVDMRMLVAEIDRLEHERSRMRPVVEAARRVAYCPHDSADGEFDDCTVALERAVKGLDANAFWKDVDKAREEHKHGRGVVYDDVEALISDLGLDAEASKRRAIEAAARAFVEWHLKGQPKTPGTLYPFTYAQQEAWHDEWDRRLTALIEAVAALA